MSCCNGDTNCEDTVKSIESTILENFSELSKEEIDNEIVSLKTKHLKASRNIYLKQKWMINHKFS